MTENTELSCLNCEQPEDIAPLVALRYKGREAWICTQCLPQLIHEPQKVAGKLAGVDGTSAVRDHR